MSEKQPFISLLVPYGNSQREIIEALTVLDAWGSEQKHTYEILAIPFCVDARVRESVARYTTLIPHARAVEYKTSRIGTLVQQSILEANGLIRIWIATPRCASCISSYQEMEYMFRERADIVVARASVQKKQIGSRLWHACASRLLRIPVLFPFGYCVAYSQKAALALFVHTRLRSRGVLLESLVQARKKNLLVKELYLKTDGVCGSVTVRDIGDIIRLTFGLWISSIHSKIRSIYSQKAHT